MSLLEVNKITPQSGTTLTLGDTGDTINFGSGVLPNFENLTVTGDLTVDTNSLYVDSANNRVGIGTASPSNSLFIVNDSNNGGVTISGSTNPALTLIDTTNNTDAVIQTTNVGSLLLDADYNNEQANSTIVFRLDGASEKMRIDSSGNVGIGTSSPNYPLTILGINNLARIYSDNTASELLIVSPTVNVIKLDTGTSDALAFGTTGTERMRIDSSGNVGIGTTSPAYPLSILSSYKGIEINDGTSTLTIESNTAGQWGNKVSGNNKWEVFTNSARRLTIDGSGNVGIGTSSPNNPQAVNLHISGTSSAIRMSDTTNSLTGNLYASGGEFSVLTSSSHPLVFKTANSERMRIDSSGQVGIGTSSPSAELHISKSADAGNAEFLIENSFVTAGSTDETVQIQGRFGGYDASYIRTGKEADFTTSGNRSSFMSFWTRGAGTLAEAIRIDSSGKVGIGTSSPSVPLDVNGITRTANAYSISYPGVPGSTSAFGAGTISADSNWGMYFRATTGAAIADFAWVNGAGTERMRIDSSGNVFMAKTTDTITTVGHYFGSNGAVNHVRDGVNVMSLGRKSSDGDILSFYKDSTKVGSIYNGGSNLGIDSSGGLLLVDDIITPTSGADNTKDLGRSSARWKDAYIGGNIYLGGTGSANALDDYEEGTWTPTLTFSSSASGSLNYTQQEGIYVKVGRLVHVSVFVAWNANNFSANSGSFEIQGLPFVNNNNNLYRGGASITYSSGAFASLTIYGQAFRAESSQSKFRFNYGPNTGGNISSEVNNYTNIGNAGSFMISGTYQTN